MVDPNIVPLLLEVELESHDPETWCLAIERDPLIALSQGHSHPMPFRGWQRLVPTTLLQLDPDGEYSMLGRRLFSRQQSTLTAHHFTAPLHPRRARVRSSAPSAFLRSIHETPFLEPHVDCIPYITRTHQLDLGETEGMVSVHLGGQHVVVSETMVSHNSVRWTFSVTASPDTLT